MRYLVLIIVFLFSFQVSAEGVFFKEESKWENLKIGEYLCDVDTYYYVGGEYTYRTTGTKYKEEDWPYQITLEIKKQELKSEYSENDFSDGYRIYVKGEWPDGSGIYKEDFWVVKRGIDTNRRIGITKPWNFSMIIITKEHDAFTIINTRPEQETVIRGSCKK